MINESKPPVNPQPARGYQRISTIRREYNAVGALPAVLRDLADQIEAMAPNVDFHDWIPNDEQGFPNPTVSLSYWGIGYGVGRRPSWRIALNYRQEERVPLPDDGSTEEATDDLPF